MKNHFVAGLLAAGIFSVLSLLMTSCDIETAPIDQTPAPTATFTATAIVAPPPSATPIPSDSPIPTPSPETAATPSASFSLTVSTIPDGIPRYDRDDWRHWIDEDGDCQNTRQEVLIAESLVAVSFQDERECRVIEGSWYAAFTGTTVTDPGDLDIDHFVPLANAHRSGAWAWTPEQKRAFANSLDDPGHLIAVTRSANRSKGARGPDEWRPPDESYWCEYATDWIRVKQEWRLSATPAEADALQEMLARCAEAVDLTIDDDG